MPMVQMAILQMIIVCSICDNFQLMEIIEGMGNLKCESYRSYNWYEASISLGIHLSRKFTEMKLY